MEFLADEDFPFPSVARLRASGLTVFSIQKESSGLKDWQVLERAVSEQFVLLTCDSDYGDLLYHEGQKPPRGVVYFRVAFMSSEEPADLLLRLLSETDLILDGKFTVVERDKIRQRALPEP